MTDSVMNFRVDEDLKKAFETIAKENDYTASQMLRHYMREVVNEYMKKHAQGDLLKQPKAKTPTKAKKQAKGPLPDAWRAK